MAYSPLMLTDNTIEEAVHTAQVAVNGLEAGRRVGWARAFEAERRADSAEHDLNVARGDIKSLTNFAARAYGIVTTLATDMVNDLFRGDHHELKSYLPKGALTAGQDAGRAYLAQRAGRLAEFKAELKDLRADRGALRAASMVELAREHGFPDVGAMNEWLSRYHAEETDGDP